MGRDRFTKNLSPLVPHRQSKEERDLRNDMYTMAGEIADAMELHPGVVAVLECDQPAAGINEAVVRVLFLDATGGDPVAFPVTAEFAVFQDADGAGFATNATLDTASKGTILNPPANPPPIADLKVKSAIDGGQSVFECKLYDLVDETVYITAFTTATGHKINCLGSLAVTFSS